MSNARVVTRHTLIVDLPVMSGPPTVRTLQSALTYAEAADVPATATYRYDKPERGSGSIVFTWWDESKDVV
jgi:hypothetical protein